MSSVIIQDTTMQNIANAIRSKNGETSKYLPSEMPGKIEAIQGGGSAEPVLIIDGDYLFYYTFNKGIFDICDFSGMTSMEHFADSSNLSILNQTELGSILNSEKVTTTLTAFSSTVLPSTIGDVYFPSSRIAQNFMMEAMGVVIIGNMDFRAATTADKFMSHCYSVKTIGDVDLSSATNIAAAFSNCTNLESIGHIKFCTSSNITIYRYAFKNCNKLKKLLNLNYSRIGGTISPSSYLYPYGTSSEPAALEALTFETFTYINTEAKDIYIPYCSMGHDAIVAMFNTMPIPGTTSTITLTGNPGVATLTDSEKAIATSKNYSLVY